MISQLKISNFVYVIVILVLVALWINPILDWGEYARHGKKRLFLADSTQVFEMWDPEYPEGFSIFLVFQEFNIETEEITFAVNLEGPENLPANFTKYKPRVIIE